MEILQKGHPPMLLLPPFSSLQHHTTPTSLTALIPRNFAYSTRSCYLMQSSRSLNSCSKTRVHSLKSRGITAIIRAGLVLGFPTYLPPSPAVWSPKKIYMLGLEISPSASSMYPPRPPPRHYGVDTLHPGRFQCLQLSLNSAR